MIQDMENMNRYREDTALWLDRNGYDPLQRGTCSLRRKLYDAMALLGVDINRKRKLLGKAGVIVVYDPETKKMSQLKVVDDQGSMSIPDIWKGPHFKVQYPQITFHH
jgi:hypothetical protein